IPAKLETELVDIEVDRLVVILDEDACQRQALMRGLSPISSRSSRYRLRNGPLPERKQERRHAPGRLGRRIVGAKVEVKIDGRFDRRPDRDGVMNGNGCREVFTSLAFQGFETPNAALVLS